MLIFVTVYTLMVTDILDGNVIVYVLCNVIESYIWQLIVSNYNVESNQN